MHHDLKDCTCQNFIFPHDNHYQYHYFMGQFTSTYFEYIENRNMILSMYVKISEFSLALAKTNT